MSAAPVWGTMLKAIVRERRAGTTLGVAVARMFPRPNPHLCRRIGPNRLHKCGFGVVTPTFDPVGATMSKRGAVASSK